MPAYIFLINNCQTEKLAVAISNTISGKSIASEIYFVNINKKHKKISVNTLDIFIDSTSPRQIFLNFKNILKIKKVLRTGNTEVFIPNIDNVFANYLFGHEAKVNILVEGMLAYTDISLKNRGRHLAVKSIISRLYGLRYKITDCHITGIDSKKTTIIYGPSVIGLEQWNNKFKEVPIFNTNDGKYKLDKKICIYVGQPYHEITDQDDYLSVAKEIAYKINGMNFKKILFKPHPLAKTKDPIIDFISFDEVILTAESCEESLLLHSAGTCIAVSSTALFNSKIIYSNNVDCFSIGMKCFPKYNIGNIDRMIGVFRSVGVEII